MEIIGVIVLIIAVIGVFSLLSSASTSIGRAHEFNRQYERGQTARQEFSSWANKMQRKTDITNTHLSKLEEVEGVDGIYTAYDHIAEIQRWQVLEEEMKWFMLGLFDFINSHCPNIKERIDNLIDDDEYDEELAKCGVIAYGLALLTISSRAFYGEDIPKHKIKSMLRGLRFDKNKRKITAWAYETTLARFRDEGRALTHPTMIILLLCNIVAGDPLDDTYHDEKYKQLKLASTHNKKYKELVDEASYIAINWLVPTPLTAFRDDICRNEAERQAKNSVTILN